MTTTPNARVILPAEATATMKDKGSTWLDGSLDRTHEAYHAMLSAAPNAGKVTEAELEAAVIAGTNKAAGFDVWGWMTDAAKEEKRQGLRAALSALGLEVEG